MKSYRTNTFLFIIAILIISTIFIGILYYYKDNIREKYSQLRTIKDQPIDKEVNYNETINITSNLSKKWDEINSKWKNILSEREISVINILYHNGSMNQQTIADELNLSSMTVSRIISKLELKNLVCRNRTGMSNTIQLNEDKLVH